MADFIVNMLETEEERRALTIQNKDYKVQVNPRMKIL